MKTREGHDLQIETSEWVPFVDVKYTEVLLCGKCYEALIMETAVAWAPQISVGGVRWQSCHGTKLNAEALHQNSRPADLIQITPGRWTARSQHREDASFVRYQTHQQGTVQQSITCGSLPAPGHDSGRSPVRYMTETSQQTSEQHASVESRLPCSGPFSWSNGPEEIRVENRNNFQGGFQCFHELDIN
jgi:hypothetical protein